MRFCDNPECNFYQYDNNLDVMELFVSTSLDERIIRRHHEYMDKYGISWYFCDTCHSACQILDKRTRLTRQA